MKLYGHPDSGHAYKVRFCLNAASIEHEYEVVDIFSDRSLRNPDFVQSSKFCEVPLLVDQGKRLIQSNAILLYVAAEYEIFGGRSTLELQACTEWLMWEANKIGLCLPQLRADKKLKGFELSTGARDWLYQRYIHDVGVLENELSDGRPFILGDQVTIADFSLSGYLMYDDDSVAGSNETRSNKTRSNEAGVEVPKNVRAWLGRLRAHNGWSKPCEMLGPAIPAQEPRA